MVQGAAMALEDALVLPASRESATTATKALADFERRRRPRTDWIREQTHRRDRARKLPPAVRTWCSTGSGPGSCSATTDH
jgi:2-polyprenyl-6-methoxyphenol hydroxylase-like FAD-dependent oxidoreductase